MMANLICYGSDGVLRVFELKPWITYQPGLCLYGNPSNLTPFKFVHNIYAYPTFYLVIQ